MQDEEFHQMKKFAKKLNTFYPECLGDDLDGGQIVDYTHAMFRKK
jgi:hypothetical protein